MKKTDEILNLCDAVCLLLADSDFAVIVNVFEQTLKFRKLNAFNGTSITNYLHTLLAAKSHSETTRLVAELDPQITYHDKYSNVELGNGHFLML